MTKKYFYRLKKHYPVHFKATPVKVREGVLAILLVYLVFASGGSLHFLFPVYNVQQFLSITGEYGCLYGITDKISMNFPVPGGLSIKWKVN